MRIPQELTKAIIQAVAEEAIIDLADISSATPLAAVIAERASERIAELKPTNITGTIGKDQSFNRISDVVALYTNGTWFIRETWT